MSPLRAATEARSRRSKSPFSVKRHKHRERRDLGDARHLVGRDLVNDAPRRRIPVWLIPGIVVGGVFAALAIAHVRVELIGQGYKRYSAVERLQALEEEKRILTAQVRELRDPARLSELAREMELSRPDRVIALAPPGSEPRP